ncbi:hypothetical protein NQ561_01505 [Anaerostipes caccae L1-92]|uniref:Uncharacterized protein n=1 Tax=Anaerostipes caccae (strain DSM 14662 / CCUG 47493 / JCM 13470 / NCIMB 13811 / L1-92) TaxID=411490 RepID=B0MEY3_ANACD|nr:hypothetical protein [Anaerostipes caccae]EDR97088.1 hypothetical protein ANACAC_02318 [Anaerostipes caccae L1-92]QMW72691.1 hypothetical protein EYQ97_16025 [Anaerostipes caccae L1-92]UWN71866.1 hypothetical protein NQ561_01505 [Anaerostipes caccae L1-92]BCD34253.1 hypothetical protein ANCC_02890 [Anaerostipes caccae L1-92]
MRLASKFLTALEGNFDSSQVEKAFFETNQLFLSQSDVSDEDISDLLDVCKEFFPLPYLTEDKQYEQLWARLEPVYYRHIKEWEQFTQAIARCRKKRKLKRLCIASLVSILFIITFVLLIVHRPVSKSECWICSGKLQSYISYESAFGVINLNSRSVSTIPKGSWEGNHSVTITSSENGTMIITSPITSESYRADIYMQADSQPDESLISKYLCTDCVKIWSENKYDVLLMDASGTPFPISDSMELALPPYTVTASSKSTECIRITFEKTK